MKKLFYATKNKFKIQSMKNRLNGLDIEIITPYDLNIDINIEEDGNTVTENATKKAQAYTKLVDMPIIAGDSALYIEKFKVQPGLHVRRINGKELNDDEMIEYYCNLVKEYGGKLTAKWIYGMVIYNGKESKEYSWSKSHFYFIDKPSQKRNPGYPLDSISIMPECNKYFVDLTDEDRNKDRANYREDDVIDFIVNNL